jgi:hypothetical protein
VYLGLTQVELRLDISEIMVEGLSLFRRDGDAEENEM